MFSLVIFMSCYLVKQSRHHSTFFVKVTMLQTIWIERTPKQLNDNQFLRISRMFHPYLSNAWHSKIHFNLFSQEHDNGSHMQFTWKLVWFWQQKIQCIKGSMIRIFSSPRHFHKSLQWLKIKPWLRKKKGLIIYRYYT